MYRFTFRKVELVGPRQDEVKMTPEAERLEYERLSFDDFDEHLQAVEGRTLPTGPSVAPWQQTLLVGPDLVLNWGQEGGANVFEGVNAKEYVSLGVGLPGPGAVHLYGTPIDTQTMVVLRPGVEVTSRTDGVARYVTVSLPVKTMREAAEAFAPSFANGLFSGPATVRLSATAGARIRHAAARIEREYRADAVDEPHSTAPRLGSSWSELREALLEECLSGLAPMVADVRPDPYRVRRVLVRRRIREVLHEAPEIKTARAFAERVGIPGRTLRAIVADEFGLSPKRLLMMRQLNLIHQDLSGAGPQDTVSGISSRHGVHEWGRMAARYAAVYGEVPSATLARSLRGERLVS